ncbi:MAG: D-proline reductase subunit gamma [Deltaproteobacteria bacterium]|jgi:D-proline reductase (dithiol) PrdB|nr:D-proline reductase subunit gamma [Deltaproteobacteria bacterium]
MYKKTLLDRLLVTFFRIPAIKNYWAGSYDALVFNDIPWTKLEKPLPECKIVLITTGGIHLKSDKEFELSDPYGDSTFRRIPNNTDIKDLIITHKYYDHQDADRDPNLVLPIEVLKELQDEGAVGPSNKYHYSFMGHIEEPHLKTLIQKSAVEAAIEIQQQKVDIALLVPA